MAQRPPAKHPAGILPRVIFALALFGVLVVTHLWLQKEANFAAGCSGFADVSVTDLSATMTEVPGCEAVTNSVYATFLGVSNIVWGLLFYGLLALLRLGYAATGNDRLRLASFGLVGAGFLYTLYLVYLQAAVIQSFCILCMTSAVTVTVLLILHVMENARLRGTSEAAAPRNVAAALRPFGLVAAVFAVLLIADVVVAQQRDEPAADVVADDQPPPDTPPAEQTPTPAITISDPATQCTYDANFEPIATIDQFADGPYRGNPDATVQVVEFFDPNCPHCKDLGATIHTVIEEHSDDARFYFQPYPLREESFGQVAALYIAQEQGRFFELMEEFFDRQRPGTWGMTLDQVVEAANDAGMDGEALRVRLENQMALQPLLADILADRAAATEVLANDNGVSVPKLAINGRIVAPTYESYSADCIGYFIEEAAGTASE